MKKRYWALLLFCCIAFYSSHAQKNFTDSVLTGVWKGTSLCQVKPSPCHDEIVVYHISKMAGRDSFQISANKIVNGAEEEMGILFFKFDRKNNQLISASAKDTWTFNLKGHRLDGTLVYNGSLYRIIKLSKQF